ncbi:globin family protein [Kaarinaea lacus]
MTPEQVELIKTSWAKVTPISEAAAEIFYSKLFELDPELKSLFKGDMKDQGKKLMAMINTAVNGLDNLEAIVPAVQDLGKRHVAYGVADKDYDTVGTALISTLEIGLDKAFTDDVREAWVTVYTVLATTMKDAATAEVA